MTLSRSSAPLVCAVAFAAAIAGRAAAQVPDDLLFKDGLECAALPAGNVGCEFYAVPLANTLASADSSFAAFVHNTASDPATVFVTGGALALPRALVVPPLDSTRIDLPWVGGLQATTASARVDGAAYRIRSDRPLAAHQFNGLASGVASSDASLLLPAHALSGDYRVVSWPSWGTFPGYFAVVGLEDETSVSVATPVEILAGGGLSGMGGTITLDRGDVVQVFAPVPGALAYGADLTGSQVTASAPIAVFGGHDASNIPAGAAYADHLEEQMAPVQALGTEFVVTMPQASPSRHFVRVTGVEDGTVLTYAPPLAGAPGSLNAGAAVTFEATVDFRLISNKAFLVSRYLEGSTVTGLGDPAMGIVVPSSQFRTEYAFAAPAFSPLGASQIWITIVGPSGASVSLDAGTVSFSPIPGTTDAVARVPVSAGSHHVEASVPVGVYVHAYEDFASYLAPAGMGLAGVAPDPGTLHPWSSAATDGGDLSVTAAAAMNGTSYGLQASVDDTNGLFVQDDTPAGEDRYRARFYFDPNGFDPGEAQGRFRTRVFILFDETPIRRLAAVVLRRLGGQYSLMARARQDDNSQANTSFVPISDGPHVVEVAWTRASGPDALDGSVEMWIDGELAGSRAGLDNNLGQVDFVRLGALSVKAGGNGTLFWDEFESRRVSLIGP